MTPQQLKAMKLALEALKWCHGGEPCGTSEAITAIEEVLAEHAMSEVQRLGQEIEQEPVAWMWNNHGSIALSRFQKVGWQPLYTAPPQRTEQPAQQEPCIHAKNPKGCYRVRCQLGDKCVDDEMSFRTAPPQPERHELQAKGEHPAPCARHCEANAFQIVIKNLKAQLAQPEQEPVAWPCLIDSADFSENTITLVMQCEDYKVSAGTHYLCTTLPKEQNQ